MSTATRKAADRAVRSSSRHVKVAPSPRCYAVAVVQDRRIVRVPERHVSITEAAGFVGAYNQVGDDCTAIIIPETLVATYEAQESRAGRGRRGKGGVA